MELDNRTRKTARYNSQNVLSGLLLCGECGKNYRRITQPSGEVVWRCADKVENGKRAVCTNMATVSDEKIREISTSGIKFGIANYLDCLFFIPPEYIFWVASGPIAWAGGGKKRMEREISISLAEDEAARADGGLHCAPALAFFTSSV